MMKTNGWLLEGFMKVLIIGAGKLGVRLAKVMDAEQFDVTLVDRNPKKVESINEQLDVLTLEGNGVDISFLKEIKASSFDLVVATTESDETNIVVCDFVKKLGCKKTIARIRGLEFSDQIEFLKETVGIDLIINPDLSTADMIAKYLLRDITYYIGEFASGRVRIVDFNIKNSQKFVGKKIMDLDDMTGLLITSVARENELLIPGGDTVLETNDTIYLMGSIETIDVFTKKYKLNGTRKAIENVMIIGGGNIGMYLARKLSKAKVHVKLVEQDRSRIQMLTEMLEHVLIIQGDGSNINLLEQEELENMQAFVTVTGIDEVNLLVALIAKQYGIEKCIAKVSRDNYAKIINNLPIDAAINPLNISVSRILKFVRGSRIESISLLLGGEGEVSELIVSKDMPFINKPLAKVNLPKGVLIGAIIHDGVVSIANGQSVIREGDRIIVFCHSSKVAQFKNIFIQKKEGRFGEIQNRT
jgi:trk system potassium uptake protein